MKAIRWIDCTAYAGLEQVGRIWRSEVDGRWEGELDSDWPVGNYVTRVQAVKAVEGGYARRVRYEQAKEAEARNTIYWEYRSDGGIEWTTPSRKGSVGRVIASEGGWMAMVWPRGTGPEATDLGWWVHAEKHLAVRAVGEYWKGEGMRDG